MEFIERKSNRFVVGLLGCLALLNLAIFAFLFGFHPNNDTDSYLYAIDFFRGDGSIIFPNRYLNPFYPLVATYLLPFVSATTSIILTNIVFYFGLVFLTYGLIRRVFASKTIGLVSALLTMGAYPMLRYALTQVQDIGGYFWFLATIYAGWRFYEESDKRWLHLAGIAIAFGVFTKESGCMAAFFVGILILAKQGIFTEKCKDIVRVSWAPLTAIFINGLRGQDMQYSSLQWFLGNWTVYAPGNYDIVKWAGVNTTTFNVLWIFVAITLFMIVQKKWVLERREKLYILAVIPSSLSYFAWPIFISRTVFISAWLIIPIATYGIVKLSRESRALFICLVALALMTPYVLQSVLRYAHLFQILEQCSWQPLCSWNYFWEHRHTFSSQM
ncbi:MAG TPA: glycosyltransferase family 39 protein [Candidatus Kapabacteria bacterium]|nr:glycosyltransferase family 39 protein [Candidatus Kapabacteria bacterium]